MQVRTALRRAPTQGSRARRARALIGEGAYSKATNSLHTEVADLSAAEQQRWGASLLPSSQQPEMAVATQSAAPEPRDGAAWNEDEAKRPKSALRGVRFRAM